MEQNEKVKYVFMHDEKDKASRFNYDGFRPTVSHASILTAISRSMIMTKN